MKTFGLLKLDYDSLQRDKGYHLNCYHQFTDKNRRTAAKKRKPKSVIATDTATDDGRELCHWRNSALKKRLKSGFDLGLRWEMVDGHLTIKWMTKPPAPGSILEFFHCSCKANKCQGGRCSCLKAHLPCTDLCKCVHCDNRKDLPSEDMSNEDESRIQD